MSCRFLVLSSLILIGCDNTSADHDMADAGAGGNSIGTGGSEATGGSESTGGSEATGGSESTGGSEATGGSESTGGSQATGGSESTGGSEGTGGSDSTEALPAELHLERVGSPQSTDNASTETLTFDVPDGVDSNSIVVVVETEDEDWRPVPSVVQNGQVVVEADVEGNYQPVLIDTAPPEDCNEDTWDSSLTASGNLDVAQLEGVTRVQGNLTINGTVTDLSALRCLTEITGNLDIGSVASLEEASLPNLVRVRGRIYVYGGDLLTTLDLPRLRLVNSLTISGLPEFTTLKAPGLIKISDTFSLTTTGSTADDVLDLQLDWLVNIGTDLSINNVANLETLDGFFALSKVGATLDIRACADLEDARGLRTIKSVGGRVFIYNNASVTHVSLAQLHDVGAVSSTSLIIQDLPELVSVAIPNLEETPASMSVYRTGSTADSDLTMDLSSLKTVRGNVDIQQVANLTNLNSLSTLELVTGGLDIRQNESLTDAMGLAALETVENGIVLYSNGELKSISLEKLSQVGATRSIALNIQALPELVLLDVSALGETPSNVYLYQLGATADGPLEIKFPILKTIRGNLDVQLVANLEGLQGFAGLQEVTGSIDVRSNGSLSNADGFSKVESVGGSIVLFSNPSLSTISLASLTDLGSGNQSLNIQALPELVNLNVGLLEETPSGIYLYQLGGSANGRMTMNFNSLNIVRSTLTVSDIDNLTTVDAFATLNQVTGNLAVEGNLDLVSLTGFDGLNSLGGNLVVRTNASLSECQPLLLRNRLQSADFDGTATISGNMTDVCN